MKKNVLWWGGGVTINSDIKRGGVQLTGISK